MIMVRVNPPYWLGLGVGCLATIIVTELLFLWKEEDGKLSVRQQQWIEKRITFRDAQLWGLYQNHTWLSEDGQHIDHWQNVSAEFTFFVLSAYYDGRMSPAVIRVVAATRTRQPRQVKCTFWFEKEPLKTSTEVVAKNKIIRENWGLNFSAYFVLCPVKGFLPDYVSVLPLNTGKATNLMKVHYNQRPFGRNKTKDLVVCVKPIHNEYNNSFKMKEFLELNQIMGVNHFVIYNHTMHANVSDVLLRYKRDNLVTILPWELQLASQKEIRTEGLFAAFNDCLYRTMYKYKYVMMIDLDEFIIPYKHDNLLQLIAFLMKPFNHTKFVGGLSFQNAFFYLQWPDDQDSKYINYPLISLRKTIRKNEFNPQGKRSKCIVLPERVIEIGNHLVWEFIPDFKILKVPSFLGFMHHYRTCEFGGEKCIHTNWTRDKRTYLWKDSLIERMKQRA